MNTPKNEIVAYIHCGKCMDSLPKGVSPQEWQRIQIGKTAAGLFQIWCVRHNCHVAYLGETAKAAN